MPPFRYGLIKKYNSDLQRRRRALQILAPWAFYSHQNRVVFRWDQGVESNWKANQEGWCSPLGHQQPSPMAVTALPLVCVVHNITCSLDRVLLMALNLLCLMTFLDMGTQTTQLINLAKEVIFLADWYHVYYTKQNHFVTRKIKKSFNENLKLKEKAVFPLFKRPEALAVMGKLFSGCQIKSKGLGRCVKMVTCIGNAKKGCHGVTAWEP